MYESHFGLRQRPFRSIPDSECYYPATPHEQALAQLLQGLQDEESLVLLTGAPGTGKTLLCHCLLDRLPENVTSVFLTHSHFAGRTGLLQALLYDLSLPYEGLGEQELRLALTDFLLKNYQEGRRTVVVLDEAQHLTADQLEELRLLGNLEGKLGKAFQVVLVGQPALIDHLADPDLAALNQRLCVRSVVEPFDLHESADYVVHRLRAAGGRPETLIVDEALELLARATHGVPRRINQVMHQALALAHSADTPRVDVEAVMEALASLGLGEDESAAMESALASDNLPELPNSVRPEPNLTLESAPSTGSAGDGEPLKDINRARRLFAAPRRPA